jgi:hypothetical protein
MWWGIFGARGEVQRRRYHGRRCVDGHTYISGEAGWGFITGGRLGFIPSGRENVGYHRGCTKAKKDKKKSRGRSNGRGGVDERERRLKREHCWVCIFRKLQSEGCLSLGGFPVLHGCAAEKNELGGEVSYDPSLSFLSLFPPFSLLVLIFVCMCGYLRRNSFSFSCVVVMRFVGITGMGFHLFYFVSWGLGESQRV